MSSNGKPFTTVTLEDGTFAVVRSDPRKPRLLEVIAIFSEAGAPETTQTQRTSKPPSSSQVSRLPPPEERKGGST